MSLTNLSRRMAIRAKNVGREADRVVKLAALAVDQTVVLATPVDTGRARSNWLVSLGSDRQDVREPYSPLPSGTDPSKASETGNAQAAISQAKSTITARKPGVPIFISNNVPYIGRLNEGSSAQAPAAFVEQAIAAGVAAVKGARIVTGR